MIESLPLLIDGGGGYGARSASALLSSVPVVPGDIDALSQSLTIGGTAYAPCAYLVADDIPAGTGIWPSRHDVSKVVSVAGSGAAPTYANNTAISNAAVRYAAAKYHTAADTTWGQATTGDCVFEAVIRSDESTAGGRMVWSTYSGGTGCAMYINNSQLYSLIYRASAAKLAFITTIAHGLYYHVMMFVDESEKYYMYLNGVLQSSELVTAFGGSVSGGALTIGAHPGGSNAGGSDLLSLAIWDLSTNPMPGAATNAAVTGAIAKERFAKVCGIQCSKSCSHSFVRASAAYTDRYTTASVRTLFPVSAGWPRVCQRQGLQPAEYGYLPEVQCTNEFIYSEDFSNAAWEKTRATVGSNAAVAPDGATTADSIIASSDANTHSVKQAMASGDSQHIFSVWAKLGAVSWMKLDVGSVANAYAYYSLGGGVMGTVGAGADSTGIEAWGNGWYRCWIEYTGGAASHYHEIFPAEADADETFAGDDATASIYIWGAQHEDDGTVIPSSYIKTTTAAATRIKDSLAYTVPTITTGKASMSARVLAGPAHSNTAVKNILSVAGANDENRIGLSVTSDYVANTVVVAANTTTASITGDDVLTDGDWHNVKATSKATLVRQTVDGDVDGADDTSATQPTGLVTLRVGCALAALSGQFGGLIRDIKLYKDVI